MSSTHRSCLLAVGLLVAVLQGQLPSVVAQHRILHATTSAASGFKASGTSTGSRIRNNWALQITRRHQTRHTSAQGQDGILEFIFHHIGTTNKFFVEFGFDKNNYESCQANTAHLYNRYGWHGLLLDGSHFNPAINLHSEFITPDNIVSLFQKHNVPAEPDYVSIDIDSTDIWLFRNIITSGVFRPRVISTEYNPNFPFDSTIAWPPNIISGNWSSRRNKFMGSSMGALHAVAQEGGYSLVWVTPPADLFWVRNDILEGVTTVQPVSHFERCGRLNLHKPAPAEEVNKYIEYHTYIRTGDLVQAAAAAQEQMRQMNVDLTRETTRF